MKLFLLGSKYFVLANQKHKLIQEQILGSMKCFLHCLKYYKSKFKNVQTVERIIEKLTSTINREKASTDRDTDLQNFNLVQQPAKCLGFQSKPIRYIRKTLKRIFQVLEGYSFKIYEDIVSFTLSSTYQRSHSYCQNRWSKVAAKLQLSSKPKIKDVNWKFMLEQIHIKKSEGFRAQIGNCN